MTEISKEYSEALFALSLETGETETYAQALNEVVDIFRENPVYMDLLCSPHIPKEERVLAVSKAFDGQVPVNVLNFLKLLVEKGRISGFYECVSEFMKLYDISRRRSIARITSAVPLTDDEKKKLITKLEQQSGNVVELSLSVDPDILGGMIVEIDGRIMDGSLRRRLKEVKDVISK